MVVVSPSMIIAKLANSAVIIWDPVSGPIQTFNYRKNKQEYDAIISSLFVLSDVRNDNTNIVSLLVITLCLEREFISF